MGCCCSSSAVEYQELLEKCSAPDVIFREEVKIFDTGRHRNVVSWTPENRAPKAIVLISHGVNEHSLRYFQVGIQLAQAGFGVFSLDHVSHGKSEGTRSVIEDHRMLYEDFVSFAEYVKAQFAPSHNAAVVCITEPTDDDEPGHQISEAANQEPLPFFLLAHSMGAMIGIMAAQSIGQEDRPGNLRAAVFSGVPIFSGPGVSSPFGIRCLYPLSQTSVASCLACCTSALAPAGMLAPVIVEELTSDSDELELLRRDPRVSPPYISNRSGYELLQLTHKVKEQVPHLTVPFVCIHGAEDTIALPKGSEYVFRNASSDIVNRQLHIIAAAKHEPFHESEPIRSAAIDFVVQYFEKRLTMLINTSTSTSNSDSSKVATLIGANSKSSSSNKAHKSSGKYEKVGTTEVDTAATDDADIVLEVHSGNITAAATTTAAAATTVDGSRVDNGIEAESLLKGTGSSSSSSSKNSSS